MDTLGRAVKLEDTFEVSAAPERVWDFMLDLEQVTPCMPGAELTELPDSRTWKGKVKIKLGAVSLAYAATAVIAEQDEQARRMVIDANGRETRPLSPRLADRLSWTRQHRVSRRP